MISQNYVPCGDYCLFSVIKLPHKCPSKGSVLLLPGLGESKCDLDYFLTNLSDTLVENGYNTLQLDLYAHGDSPGEFEQLSSCIIADNIRSAIKYIREQTSHLPFVICRGIISEFMSDQSLMEEIKGLITISPAKLARADLEVVKSALSNEPDIVEYGSFQRQQLIDKFFIMMGAEPDNMLTRRIRIQFIKDILERLSQSSWTSKHYNNTVWISANIDNLSLNVDYDFSAVKIKSLAYYEGYALPRNILWQHKFLLSTVANIRRMSR